MKGSSVLVTGGAGFIGSHLAEELLKLDARVTVVDVSEGNKNRNLGSVLDQLDFVKCDLANYEDVCKLLNKDFEYIFHLAASSFLHICEKCPDTAFRNNVHSTYNLLKFATNLKHLRKIVFPSSALLYGRNPEYIPIDEKHATEPTESIYNTTKVMGEVLFENFRKKHSLPVVVFRLFNVFGPRQTEDYIIPTTIMQAIRKGVVELWSDKPTRDFTFVADTVNAFIRGAESDFVGGPINIGSGREVSIGRVASQIAQELRAELRFLNKDVSGSLRLCCDNNLAKKMLNWEPRIKFEDGLKTTIDWYTKNKEKLFSLSGADKA